MIFQSNAICKYFNHANQNKDQCSSNITFINLNIPSIRFWKNIATILNTIYRSFKNFITLKELWWLINKIILKISQ